MSAPGSPASVSAALPAALVLNFVQAATAVAMLAVPVLAPLVAADMGFAPTFLGSYQAALWTAAIVSSSLVGLLIGRLGPVRTSQIVTVLAALSLAAAGSGTTVLFALSAVVLGAACGMETPASSALLARVTPPRAQPFIFSLKQTGMQIGAIVAGLALPWLAATLGWRGALVAGAGLSFVALALLAGWRGRLDTGPEPARPVAAGRLGALGEVLRRPALRSLSIASFGFSALQVCVNAFLVTYLVHEAGRSLLAAGVILAAAQAGGLAGRLAWGLLSGRTGAARRVLAALGIAMAVASVLLGVFGAKLADGPLTLLAIALGLTASGWNGVFLAEVARLAPRSEVSAVTGAALIVTFVGLIAGPLAYAALAAHWGYGEAFVGIGLVALAGALALAPRRGLS